MIIIDATNKILGRIATFAAKQALMGEEVRIINAEKAVISGKKDEIIERYKSKYQRGIPAKGPFIHRMPDRFVRRIVRGMLPYSQPRGREAYKRVLCYIGVPAEFENVDKIEIAEADVSKIVNTKYITVKELTKILGAKE